MMREGFPLPDTDWPPAAEFWAGAARHELLIPRCENCDRYQWYPQDSCPRCGASSWTWTKMSGRASLFSWVVVTHAFLAEYAGMVPYVTGLVALEEDPSVRLVTRIVDADPSELAFDQRLEVTFAPISFTGVRGEVTAPLFRPSRTSGRPLGEHRLSEGDR